MTSLPRIQFDLPAHEYRAADGVSITPLKHMALSPAHYREAIAHPPEQTPAMLLGTLTHTAIFEPLQNLKGSFVAKPEGMSFATKEGKAWRDAQTAPIISAEDATALNGMTNAVYAHREVARLLNKGRAEVSMFATDSTGLTIKGRADWLCEDRPVLCDLKTIECAADFEREAAQRKYHVQEAYYRALAAANGIEVEGFIFIVVEKQPPYGVRLVQFNEEAVAVGRSLYRGWLDKLAYCEANDEWPCYSLELQTIWLPAWAREQ